MAHSDRHGIAPTTRALGYAGLLPQLLAVLFQLPIGPPWWRALGQVAPAFALFYGAAILSFLGGVWWGFAVRRPGAAQARLALIAVVPSLVAVALIMSAAFDPRRALVMLGSAILLTLLVDRRLAQAGEAPDGWMRLRVPLSVGLGMLTILAALLMPRLFV